MIQISETAKKQLIKLFEEQNTGIENSYLRVDVTSGGCSGLKYELDIVNNTSENDKIVENKGVKILINKKAYLYLVGTTLEFQGGLKGKGFEFINPNAKRTCGCGESFSL